MENAMESMHDDIMISVANLCKEYRLYDSNKERLKGLLRLTRTCNYRPHHALDHINFQIRKGETVGIIGVNGSGKSTLLKILTGVVTPTSGEVKVNGRISALLELGAGFNPEYTGMENIYLNGTMMNYSRREIEAYIPSIIEFADIGEFIHQPVKNYSSGMFARLAFAVAISVKPEILIVDEALSVGDIFFQAKCFKKFEEFRQKGVTVLFVSHDLSSISKYCSRAILLDRGKLVAEGTPKETVDLYKRLLSRSAPDPRATPVKLGQPEGGCWRSGMSCNPDVLEYGNKLAEIVDFAIMNDEETVTSTISKGETFTVRMKVRFNADIEEPIFAFSIKNRLGIELAGTNTQLEGKQLARGERGKTYTAVFTQKMMLQGGDYLLSLGCTGYGRDHLEVYHRLYDICSFVVVSNKNTVGYCDLDSTVDIEPA